MTMQIAAPPRAKEAQMDSAGSRNDWITGIGAVGAGLGMLAFALFPLAIPIVVLTIVALLPLALPLVAVALIAAILTGVWLAIRAVGRGIRRLGRTSRHKGVRPEGTVHTARGDSLNPVFRDGTAGVPRS
jgi:hypothetical protein